jgi:predicted GNAT superfamily acetyltransferase
MIESTTSTDIRLLEGPDELAAADALLQEIWGAPTPIVSLEMLTAIAHSGGYVAGAFDGRRLVGASVGFLATHHDDAALHSHVTGLLGDRRGAGMGRRLKLHQRSWAAERGIDWITWTFDPLVRANAWFNLAVLGADVDAYLPSFYGEMTDAINAGDDSDRLHVAWRVAAPLPERPRDGRDVADPLLVPTPDDVVALRRTDPVAVQRWRIETRQRLMRPLAAGAHIAGFDRAGHYVIAGGGRR